MYRIIFKLCIVLSIVSPSLLVQYNYRKYNVDNEAVKLYGEDLKSVLKKFRRTPAYLKILQDKLEDLKTSAKEMSLQVLHYYHGKLEEKIVEIIPTTTEVPGASQSLRQKETMEKLYIPAYPGFGNRRTGEPTTESSVEDSSQRINNLDNYKVFDSELSVSEQNSLKDLGFEYAGKIIHSIIENMGPKTETGSTLKFTQIPEGGQYDGKIVETTPTTTHPPEHAVRHGTHKEDDGGPVQEDASAPTEPYQFRANNATQPNKAA